MQTFTYLLMGFLVVCAVSVSFSRNLLNSILIFMSYSLVMSIIWILLESPDLAITEAAVGAGGALSTLPLSPIGFRPIWGPFGRPNLGQDKGACT